MLFSSKQRESSSLGRATRRSVILAQVGVDNALPELKRKMAGAASLGGNMSAVIALMAKDRGGPKIRLQVLFDPATDTVFETESYRDFDHGRFPARAFMKFGWDIYAPDAKTRKEPYAAPLQASIEQLRGLLLALQDFGLKWIHAMPQRYQQLEAVENGVVSRIHIHEPTSP